VATPEESPVTSSPREPSGPVDPRGRTRSEPGPLSWRDAGILVALFLGGILLWSFGTFLILLGLGYPEAPHHPPGLSTSLVDALWHVGTAALLALAARDRVVLVVAPVLSLGLDIDHLFGTVFPTVLPRSAHDLFLIGALGLVIYFLRGRPSAFVAAGAILVHIGVDGGGFPLLSPVTTTFYTLDLPLQIILVAGAGLLFALAVRPLRALRARENWLPLVVVVVVLSSIVALGWAYILPYTRG
jgi:hypothetical protein